MKLIEIYKQIILEGIDLFSIEKAKIEGFEINILKETEDDFIAKIDYPKESGVFYLIIDKSKQVKYGIDNGDGTIDFYKDLNINYRQKLLSTIFGLIRYYVDKFNINNLIFLTKDRRRSVLFDLYLTKNFTDFNKIERKLGTNNIIQYNLNKK